MDIAKLRLWLSIVIDDEITEDAGNGEFDAHSKPRQLPNLDCNIICGNSLIDEFEENELITESVLLNNVSENSQGSVFQKSVDGLIAKLIELQDKLFFTKEHEEKEDIKSQIQTIYDDIILEQIGGDFELRDDYYESLSESSKPFILWQLYFPKVFKENGGFDIVIGNPPYVGEKGNKEIFRPIAATKFGKRCYYGKMDLFYFFFHKALDLGNSTAEISLITTNYFPTAFGGVLLRKDFMERSQVRRLINFNELKIFESALGQHNMITMLTKDKSKAIVAENCLCKVSKYADSNLLKNVLYAVGQNNEIFESYSVPQENLYDGSECYIRISGCGINQENSNDSILSKITESKKLLKDIADIKQGIVSGADKYTDAHEAKYGLGHPKGKGIFVLPKEQLENLDFPDDEKKKYLKRVYKNSQISRYSIAYSDDLYVLYITKEVEVDDAPKMIEYLKQFKPILAAKREAIEGKMPWYSLNWAREKRIFEAKEKIVNSRRSKGNIFALDTEQCYEQSDIMITVIKKEYQKEYPPKYVLGLLNSKLYYFWLKNRGKLKGDMLELYGKPLEEIPVINASEEIKSNIVECVNSLLEENVHNEALVDKIDKLVYKAVGLSDEEIKIIEGE